MLYSEEFPETPPQHSRLVQARHRVQTAVGECVEWCVSLPFIGAADCFLFWYLVVSLPFYFVRFPTDAEGVMWFLFHIVLMVGAPLLRVHVYPLRHRHILIQWVLDLYPLALFMALYSEVAVLNRRVHGDRFFDKEIADLEEDIFGVQVSAKMAGWVDSKVVGEYLHFCYFAYYFVVASPVLIYFTRSKVVYHKSLGAIALTFIIGFMIFILFPVEGPFWYLTPPKPKNVGYAFSHLCNWLVSGGSANGTAFPSSHTSVGVVSWFVAYRFHRPLFQSYFFIVPGLIWATIYGGFHYAVDTVAGFFLGIFAGTVGLSLSCRVHEFLMLRQSDYLDIDDDDEEKGEDFAGSLDLFTSGQRVVT